jgi:isocitrate/isopropylmalate dehydrogenase
VLRAAAERSASEDGSGDGASIERASEAIYEAALETVGAGIKTPDLGGGAGTTQFTDAVLERVRAKLGG